MNMRAALLALVGLLVASAAQAQTAAELIEQAVAKSPLRFPGEATIVKWKPDFTYDVVRKGTNTLVCYDRSDERDRSPFAAQCTSLTNLPRVAQNRKLRAETKNTAEETAAIAAAEKNGTRVKPEYGSLWLRMDGRDKDTAMLHVTISVPGATTASIGLPDNGKAGGAWLMEAGTTAAHIMVPGR
jgi:hypothetical protein